MLSVGVVVLGVGEVDRAAAFWGEALGYERLTDGFGGWATVLTPPDGGAGPNIRWSAARHHRRITRACIWIFTYPVPPSRRSRLRGWWRLALNASTGTAIPTTRTSSCLRTPTAIASASSTSATSTTDLAV